MLAESLIAKIADELSLAPKQVQRTLVLFDEGNTLPFIARYRKEATGGLDEVQLRDVRDRAGYLAELEDRRETVLESIDEQGKLTDELRGRIEAAETKQVLEDLYLPYKPKRRTRATKARERGLEPLADLIWEGAATDAEVAGAAAEYVDPESDVETEEDALQGARDILAERISEDAELRGWIRDRTRSEGVVRSSVMPGKEEESSKFQDYYDYSEKLTKIPSHRMLAIRRGETEEFLTWTIDAPVEEIEAEMRRRLVGGRAATEQMRQVVDDAYKRLLSTSILGELRVELKERAEEEAISIFGQNMEQLLLAPPAGERVVIGLDPGYRTGVKVGVVSRTGAVLDTDTLYLHKPDAFAEGLKRLVETHGSELVAIGNGTASRETESAARKVVDALDGDRPQVVVVNESGASVYSASEIAREEMPDLDVSLRGAVSIARRLQDPLAELVKIDPKSIGVGQYQHDVNQTKLRRRLDEVVEICVNRVGVEVNTASVPLLSYVAGIGPTVASNIVEYRDDRGGIASRADLLEVRRVGPKSFQQSAGFLRVRGGDNPLDATAVHPERYELVERITDDLDTELPDLLENETVIERIDPERYLAEEVGLPTLRDIMEELRKPGRDPRDTFEAPSFRDDVRKPKDLKPGMSLEGVVTNIVAFGAFVDVGVHQDGLVHISEVADHFVRDANDEVSVGEKVRVTVLSVDLERERIALSMKKNPEIGGGGEDAGGGGRKKKSKGKKSKRRGKRKKKGRSRDWKSGDVAPNGIRFS